MFSNFSRDKIIETMEKLNIELKKSNKLSDLSFYINQTLKELKKSEGVAFTSAYQVFLNTAPTKLWIEHITLTPTEKILWDELFSMNQLGNNNWGASVGW